MKRVRLHAIALLTFAAAAAPAAAQSSIEDAVQQLTGPSARGYMQPVADLFGANLNSGFFSGPAVSHGLSFRLSIVGMVSAITDDQKMYQAPLPDGFTPSDAPTGSTTGHFLTATMFGGTGTTVHDQNNPSLSYRGSDGLVNPDSFPSFLANRFPLAVPQVAIGGIAGLELLGRYAASPDLKSNSSGSSTDFGKVTLYSFGARYNVSKFLPMLPLDLAVGAYKSKFKIGDIVDADGMTYGVQASKSFPILTLYGGVSKEKTTLKLDYTSTDPNTAGTEIKIDLDGANTSRFTGGASIKLLFLRVFADANFGKVNSYSGGVSFGN